VVNLFVVALAFALALVLALFLFQTGARRLYDYAITETNFEIRLFGRFAVFRVPLRDIQDAALWRASFPDIVAAATTLRAGNRVAAHAVVITRSGGGFPHRIIITPDDPGDVIAELHARIHPVSGRPALQD
jgi:hypothetical protein